MNKTALSFLTLFMLCAALFLLFPELDLLAARLFYHPEHAFFLEGNPLVQFGYRANRWIVRALALCLIGGWILFAWLRPFQGMNRLFLYLILALALGPGLIVNTIFKDQWGRARPLQTTYFGGEKQFTPALVMAQECEKNCSFVSGHASTGFYAFAFALLARRRRFAWCSGALMLGSLMGFGRMAQGAHFLSDVMFSGIFVSFTAWMLYRILKPPSLPLENPPQSP